MRRKWLLVLGIIGLSIGMVGCGEVNQEEQVATPAESQNIIPSEVEIEVEGMVVSNRTIALDIDLPAKIQQIHVKAGEKVIKGQPLISIDPALYNQQLEQAKLQEQLQEATNALSENKLPIYEQQRIVLQQSIDEKKAILQSKASPEYLIYNSQLEEIEENRFQLEEDYDAIDTVYKLIDTSEQSREDIRLAIENLDRKALTIGYQIQQLETLQQQEVTSLESQMEELTLLIDQYTQQQEIVTQVNALNQQLQTLQVEHLEMIGEKDELVENQLITPEEELVVSQIYVQEGMVTSGILGPVIELVDLKGLEIRAKVPEEYLHDIVIGDVVTIIPYTDQSQRLSGVVSDKGVLAIDYYGEKMIDVYVTVDEKPELLVVGGSVDVVF